LDPYLVKLNVSGMCLMVWKNGEIVFSSNSKGILPHLEAIEKLGREFLTNSVMVDKIVGRAAALLMLYSTPTEVHAGVITTKAKELLETGGVVVCPDVEVPAIKERDGRIYCPFELMVQEIGDPEEAYLALVGKMQNLRRPTRG
jgi:hypothetical protein